mmetsp:Transcript_2656/g.8533  ORF Transcript_2656/g.8533 Transcript_2656/m.8533 type:complete len:214 (+) Transcript_2656:1909-2550(+)
MSAQVARCMASGEKASATTWFTHGRANMAAEPIAVDAMRRMARVAARRAGGSSGESAPINRTIAATVAVSATNESTRRPCSSARLSRATRALWANCWAEVDSSTAVDVMSEASGETPPLPTTSAMRLASAFGLSATTKSSAMWSACCTDEPRSDTRVAVPDDVTKDGNSSSSADERLTTMSADEAQAAEPRPRASSGRRRLSNVVAKSSAAAT